MNEYFNYCEYLFNDFLNGKMQNGNLNFEMDACPEPYLNFGVDLNSNNQLIFLTTNPGKSDEYQLFKNINSKISFIDKKLSYKDNSINFAKYYEKNLVGTAKHRITHMFQFAESLGYKGFLQIETIPFHSKNLNKTNINSIIMNNKTLSEYNYLLGKFIKDKNVIIISGADRTNIYNIPKWIKYQCNLIGLDISSSDIVELVKKENNPTAIAYVLNNSNKIKTAVLKMGSNDLPKKENQQPLINKLLNSN